MAPSLIEPYFPSYEVASQRIVGADSIGAEYSPVTPFLYEKQHLLFLGSVFNVPQAVFEPLRLLSIDAEKVHQVVEHLELTVVSKKHWWNLTELREVLPVTLDSVLDPQDGISNRNRYLIWNSTKILDQLVALQIVETETTLEIEVTFGDIEETGWIVVSKESGITPLPLWGERQQFMVINEGGVEYLAPICVRMLESLPPTQPHPTEGRLSESELFAALQPDFPWITEQDIFENGADLASIFIDMRNVNYDRLFELYRSFINGKLLDQVPEKADFFNTIVENPNQAELVYLAARRFARLVEMAGVYEVLKFSEDIPISHETVQEFLASQTAEDRKYLADKFLTELKLRTSLHFQKRWQLERELFGTHFPGQDGVYIDEFASDVTVHKRVYGQHRNGHILLALIPDDIGDFVVDERSINAEKFIQSFVDVLAHENGHLGRHFKRTTYL